MPNQPTDSFGPYQQSARATRAKSVGALALGATALAALPADAKAQIIVSTAAPATISTTGSHYLFVNLEAAVFPTGNAGVAYLGARSNFGDGNVSYAGGFNNNNGNRYTWAIVNTNDAQNFSAGAQIGSGTVFGNRAYMNGLNSGVIAAWTGTTGYLGFKIALGDGNHYGWANITTNSDASTVTLNAIGFNAAPNQPIFAGQTVVPEPSTVALLALGAAGLVAYRQRKKIARAA